MKYIDAEKLKAEIERRIANGQDGYGGNLKALLLFIASLQQEQPEVDLEKELDRYLRGEFQQTAGGNFNNYIQVGCHTAEWGAIHLNARKEK